MKTLTKTSGMTDLAVIFFLVEECHVRLKSAIMVTIVQEDMSESFWMRALPNPTKHNGKAEASIHFWHFDRQVQMKTSHTFVKLRFFGGLQTRFKSGFHVNLCSVHCRENEGDRCTFNLNNALSGAAYSSFIYYYLTSQLNLFLAGRCASINLKLFAWEITKLYVCLCSI